MQTRPFTLIDWANVPGLLDWVGFVIGIVGFIIAYFQFRKTRNSFDAAKQAVEQTRKDLIYKRLTAAADNLGSQAAVLGRAVDENDRPIAAHVLNSFASKMGDFRALLVESGYSEQELLDDLKRTAASLATMRASLYRTKTSPLDDLYVHAMEPLHQLTEKLAAVSTQVQVAADSSLSGSAKRKSWWMFWRRKV